MPPRSAAIVTLAFLVFRADSLLGAFGVATPCPASMPPADAAGVAWYPADPRYAIGAGRELLARGDNAPALCYLRLAEAAGVRDAAYWFDLGDAYDANGQAAPALAAWERARALGYDPDAVLAKLRAGYEAAGEWDKAAGVLEAWIARHPEDREALYRLTLITAAQDPAGALPDLTALGGSVGEHAADSKALAAVIQSALTYNDPAFALARTGQELVRLGEPALAVTALQGAVRANPGYGEAYALLGLAQEAEGVDPAESYVAGVRLSPDSEMACLLYGSFLRRHGKYALAHWWLAQAWALKPGDWTVAAELAKTDFAGGDPARAEQWLLQSIEANPKEPEAWIALAAFYIGNDLRVEESGIPAARQALLLAPDDPQALDLLGWGWFKLGDFAEAERLLRMAIEVDPRSASAHLHLGMTLIEEGRLDEAKMELQAAIQLDPSGDIGRQAREQLARIL